MNRVKCMVMTVVIVSVLLTGCNPVSLNIGRNNSENEHRDSYFSGLVNIEDYGKNHNEVFIPSDFLQDRLGIGEFDSYDAVIEALESGEGYAYITLDGYDGDILVITDAVYDNLDGNMASIDAYLYAMVNGKAVNIGNAFSSGTAYPISYDGKRLYIAGNHDYTEMCVCPDTNGLMVMITIMQDFDKDGNSSYTGFIRETNSFDVEETDIDIKSDDEFYDYVSKYLEKEIINYTVIE